MASGHGRDVVEMSHDDGGGLWGCSEDLSEAVILSSFEVFQGGFGNDGDGESIFHLRANKLLVETAREEARVTGGTDAKVRKDVHAAAGFGGVMADQVEGVDLSPGLDRYPEVVEVSGCRNRGAVEGEIGGRW